MRIKQTLIVSFAGIALLVGVVGYFSISLSRQIWGLRTTELPMEQNLGEVEVSIWEAIHAADSFRLSGNKVYKERYGLQIGKVEEFLSNYAGLTDTRQETQYLEEFRNSWQAAKAAAGKMIELTEKQKAAEDIFFVNVDEADDVIDFEIQGKWKLTDPDLLQKEQNVREVEVSIWEAIHAGQQFTGLSGDIVRGKQKYIGSAREAAKRGAKASLVKGDFADLMEKQFEDVEEHWTKYKELPLESFEKDAIKEFEQYWQQAVKAGREVVLLHNQAEEQFNILFAEIDRADNVIDFKMQEFIKKRIDTEDQKAKRARTATVIIGGLAFACVVVIGIFASRSICRPIANLRDAVVEIGKGNLGARADISSNSEIGVLADAFNKTAYNLKKSVDTLNREIAERKKAERALREGKERFKQVAESAGDWIWEVDTEGLYTYASPVVEKILGYTPEEIVGKKRFYDFFDPDTKEKLKKTAFEAFARRESFKGFVNFNIHKNGSTVILETNGTPIVDDGGNLCGYRGADRDITERKQAEEKNMQTLSLLAATLESTADGILVVALNGKVVSYNQKFQQLWHIPDELIESNDDETLLAFVLSQLSDPEGFMVGVRRLYADVEKESFDLLSFKDGRVFERFSQPQKIENRIVGRVWSFRDVTERRRAEETLEKLNKDLRATVALLTRSNRQLSEFAHLAVHDLKTPLRGISTIAQWLVNDYKEKFDEAGCQQIELLVERVERINELINAVLHYSTIARVKNKEHPVDLNELVKNVIVEIGPPQNIKVTVSGNLPIVVCEAALLRQVFYHLLTNAVKFMDKPEGRITLDCVDKNTLWVFSVSDNGPGVTHQHFERIFRLFQRLDGGDQSDSRGVGLTITKKIIELYGGQIWLTSELGRGSTFFFTIPKVLSTNNSEELFLVASR